MHYRGLSRGNSGKFTLYYKQFTIYVCLIIKSYSNLELIPIKVVVNLRIIHFTVSQFVNAV